MSMETIQLVLREYPDRYQITEVDRVAIFRGFSGAAVYRLPTLAGEFALRQWPGQALESERIRGLHRLLDGVAEWGVSQVAVPVAANDGKTLVETGSGRWQLEPWKPGAADFLESPSLEKLESAMRTLAEWHRAAVMFIPSATEHKWFHCEPAAASPGVHERLEKLHAWMSGRLHRVEQALPAYPADEFRELAAEVLKACAAHGPAIANELRHQASKSFRLQPCLRDVWHDHILFSGSEVTGLIDASACRVENVATDLARLIGSLVKDDAAMWNHAVDAYRKHNPLLDAEWELMRCFDRSQVLLSGLFWVNRKYLRGVKFRDEDAVLRRLRTIVERQRALTT